MKQALKECSPNISKWSNKRFLDFKNADEDLALLAKAIGNPIRLAIMRMLLEKNSCICSDFVDELPLAQSTISQHLKVLKEAGLIKGTISGPSICYCIDDVGLKRFKVLVALL